MRISSKARLLAAVFGTGAMLFAAGAACAETLADAIALAYSTNPTILRQRSALRVQDETYYQTDRNTGTAVTADVTVNGSTNNSLTDGDDHGSQSNGYSAGITASQTLYSGGRLTGRLAQTEAQLQSARETLRNTEMTVLGDVVDVYTGVLRAEESLRITTENVQVLQRQKDEAQTRFEVGASTRTDVAQAESRLASARGQLTTAQNTLDNARAQYRTIVGKSPETLAPAPDLTRLLPPSAAAAFDSAEKNNPTLRGAYLNERASAANISVQEATRRPQVTFSTGINGGQSNGANPFPGVNAGYSDFSANLTTSARITVPLFTGFTTNSVIRQAKETNRGDNIAIEQARRNLNQTVTTSWNALVSARSQIASQQEAVRASQLAAEGTREEQQVGLRTTLDLLNAEQELRSSQLSLVNARFTEYTAQVDLLTAMGQLSPETFGAQVEKYDPKAHFNEVNSFTLPWEPILKTLDRIGAPPIPERAPLPGENVPPVEPLR